MHDEYAQSLYLAFVLCVVQTLTFDSIPKPLYIVFSLNKVRLKKKNGSFS